MEVVTVAPSGGLDNSSIVAGVIGGRYPCVVIMAHWLSDLTEGRIPLLVVRIMTSAVAFCLVMFASELLKNRETSLIPPPVALFLLGWSSILMMLSIWLALRTPYGGGPQHPASGPGLHDGGNAVWWSIYAASFAGTLMGSVWALRIYARKTRRRHLSPCPHHDQLMEEMNRNIQTAVEIASGRSL